MSGYASEAVFIWLLFALLTVVLRRDRRLLYRFPMWGGAVLVGWLLITAAVQTRRGFALETLFDSTTLYRVFAVAGGLTIPAWSAWGRRWWEIRGVVWCVGWWRWPLACVVLGLCAAGVYAWLGYLLAEAGMLRGNNVLFHADGYKFDLAYRGLARDHEHAVLKHPLFALVARVVGLPLGAVVRGERVGVLANALLGGFSIALAAQYFRVIAGSAARALLLAFLLAATSTHVVFGAVPETYALAACSLILVHLLLGMRERGRMRVRHETLAAALTIGVTVTNVYQAAVCFVLPRLRTWRRRQVLRWGLTVPAVVALGMVLQGAAIPEAALRASDLGMYSDEAGYFSDEGWLPSGATLRQTLGGLLVTGVVGADPVPEFDPEYGWLVMMGGQQSWRSRVAAGFWMGLLAASVVVLIWRRYLPLTLQAALLTIAGHGVLHSYYGSEHVFLYGGFYTFAVVGVIAHAVRVGPGWLVWVVGVAGPLLAIHTAVFCVRVLELLEAAPRL